MSEIIGENINQNSINQATGDSQSIDPLTEPSILVLHESSMLSTSDTVDARTLKELFGLKRTASPMGQLTTAYDSMMYNMKHQNRGKCIILNHKSYDPKCQLNERRGTEADAKALYTCFRSLDFDVILYNDTTAQDIGIILDKASKDDHSNNDCIIVCVLTHGEQGSLWAHDTKYSTDLIFNKFKGDVCPSLAGKPKIFIIQACQGDKLDPGVAIRALDVTDAGTLSYRIPTFADFLICYSTIPGYYSWRNTTNGSWFVQALTQVLGEHSNQLDLMTILTMVNRKVAYEFESNVPNDTDFDRKKQIPFIASMLTRLVYFPSKI
jgi:hypothetical protein